MPLLLTKERLYGSKVQTKETLGESRERLGKDQGETRERLGRDYGEIRERLDETSKSKRPKQETKDDAIAGGIIQRLSRQPDCESKNKQE